MLNDAAFYETAKEILKSLKEAPKEQDTLLWIEKGYIVKKGRKYYLNTGLTGIPENIRKHFINIIRHQNTIEVLIEMYNEKNIDKLEKLLKK